MARTQVVAFDVGGTLIYTIDSIGETYARVAKQHGCRLDPDAVNEAFASARGTARKGAVPSNGKDHAYWKDIVRKSLPSTAFTETDKFEAYFSELYDLYANPKMWGVYPEVFEVLRELADRGLELIVISNWDNRLHPILEGLGLGTFFSQRFISAELGWEKPDPALFRHVSDVMRLDGSKMLAVGDDLKNDVDAPKKAGWKAVLIERPRHDLWNVKTALSKR